MGNFYGNVVLLGPTHDAVAKAVEDLGARAWIVGEGTATVVYDDREMDLDALCQLAASLSATLECPALAFLNHDDDVLRFTLAERGELVDRYDSNPGYFEDRGGRATGGDAERLCAAFNVPGSAKKLHRLLRRKRETVGAEVERHQELLYLLDLPVALGVLGFTYVERGELPQGASASVPRAVGGADVPRPEKSPASVQVPASRPNPNQFRTGQGLPDESISAIFSLWWGIYTVPSRFEPVFGAGRVNGLMALLRAAGYMAIHATKDFPDNRLTLDPLLADFFGQESLDVSELPFLAVRAFGIAEQPAHGGSAFTTGEPRQFAARWVQTVFRLVEDADVAAAYPLDSMIRLEMPEKEREFAVAVLSLALNDFEAPARFESLLYKGRINGLLALGFAARDLKRRSRRNLWGASVSLNPLLTELFGQKKLEHFDIPSVAMRAFGVAPATEDEITALRIGDPDIMRRYRRADSDVRVATKDEMYKGLLKAVRRQLMWG